MNININVRTELGRWSKAQHLLLESWNGALRGVGGILRMNSDVRSGLGRRSKARHLLRSILLGVEAIIQTRLASRSNILHLVGGILGCALAIIQRLLRRNVVFRLPAGARWRHHVATPANTVIAVRVDSGLGRSDILHLVGGILGCALALIQRLVQLNVLFLLQTGAR